MNAMTASSVYKTIELESGVVGADSHKLIAMLYQGALIAIANAKSAIERKDLVAKGQAISKAIMIIEDGLRASLDKNVGGQLALNLDALYAYMGTRLLAANLNNDVEPLDEVTRLLGELKGAWDSIRQTVMNSSATANTPPPAQNKQQSMVYGRG